MSIWDEDVYTIRSNNCRPSTQNRDVGIIAHPNVQAGNFLGADEAQFIGNMVSVAPESATAKQACDEGRAGDMDRWSRRNMIDVEREMENNADGALHEEDSRRT